MNMLEIQHLSKSFNSEIVINDISLNIPQYSVYGFLGKNGAGKTTTMKLIVGLLEAEHGSIHVNGEKVQYGQSRTNQHIGYLSDVPEFYGYMKPREYLKLCGEITGMSKIEIQQKSDELLKVVGLYDANRKISGFSRGMKQRLGIAQALLNEPKLLICDEPTSALDPIGRKEILDILSVVKDKTTVLFSTHILADVERICDRVAVLSKGSIVMQGELLKLKNKHAHDEVCIEFKDEKGKQIILKAIENHNEIRVKKEDKLSCIFHVSNVEQNGKQLLELLTFNHCSILKYEVLEPTLESLFMEVVK